MTVVVRFRFTEPNCWSSRLALHRLRRESARSGPGLLPAPSPSDAPFPLLHQAQRDSVWPVCPTLGSMDETQVIQQVGRQLHGVQKLRVGVAPFPRVIFWPAFPCQEECPLALRVPSTLRTYSPHSTQKVEKKDSGFTPFFPRLPASQSCLTVAALAQLPVQRHGENTPRSRVIRGGGACSWGPRWATPRAAGRRHRRLGWWLSGFRDSGLGNKDSGYKG